eukprot:COSAG06_NODE_10635_length_1643_cov_36.732686_2_plen_32_part_01
MRTTTATDDGGRLLLTLLSVSSGPSHGAALAA